MSAETNTSQFQAHKSQHNPDIEGVSSLTLYEDQDSGLTQLVEFLQTCWGQDLEEGKHHLPNNQERPLLKRYHKAHLVLRQLMLEADTDALDYVALLKYQPWMYGCECARLEPIHLNDQPDTFVYRNPDSAIDLIKIVTPLDKDERLFLYDQDLIGWHQGPALARALGQLQIAQEQVVQQLSAHKRESGRVSARLIIGHTHREHEQIKALRQLNHHLNYIEVLTFDQLGYGGQQVISALEETCMIPDSE